MKNCTKVVGGLQFEWIPFYLREFHKSSDKNIVFVTSSAKNLLYFSKFQENFIILQEGKRLSRVAALYQSLTIGKHIIFTTFPAIEQKTSPIEYFLETFQIILHKTISMALLQRKLFEFGYVRTEISETRGQFSVRGGIFDIFPMLSKVPYRIEFLGDTIEFIKPFDVKTQISVKENIDKITITKAKEILSNFTFMDYLDPQNTVFIYDFGVMENDITKEFEIVKTQPFRSNQENYAIQNNFSGNIRIDTGLEEFISDTKKHEKNIISVSSCGAKRIISEIIRQQRGRQEFPILSTPLSYGFIRENTAIYTEKELFGYILRNSYKKSIKKNIFKNYSGMEVGSYVVHKNHGIAIFNGITNIDIDGFPHDFLSLTYKNNDKLFVPVENIDLVSKYGIENENIDIECDRLGGTAWAKSKEKIYKKLLIIAEDLLKIAARRKLQKIEPIVIFEEEYEEFCKKFPYMETDDQISAITDVINDLTDTVPADRLICGDVGFGKTEIAIRAAYLVASNKKQVVIIAPTTILVEQHYKNFIKRFEGFGIEICKISRFLDARELKNNIEKIKNGEVGIIIATHAIFSKKIHFKNLGMLIIDEEQHFGVRQKEFIKSIKDDIHVFTITATPIPRTLQMAISGIRDLSIIASPPPDRLSVKTYITNLGDDIIKKAITNELDRNGQVFVVSPRIEFLEKIYKNITKLAPTGTNIKIAHGKSIDIEQTIAKFCDGKIDILVSTNIIDSGIDIQNANLIIIERADMFGLAQLYQLRGRVGRNSETQGYAYMCIPEKITPLAQKRLELIEKLEELGSGFSLSAHDLEIRGAGNIAGDEQSGYIREVGIELYQNMLERAISMKDSDQISPQISIGVPILIPESYISENNLRISMYRKIGDLKSYADVENLEFEFIDRFGNIPEELSNLFNVIRIKLNCIRANIDRIDVGKNGFSISFANNQYEDPKKLISLLDNNKDTVKLRLDDHKIAITKQWKTHNKRVEDILKITKFLTLPK
ncbi:MAG: DEAD/DEAH box helicase [Holosporales bacterium]|jgi:transcription-repair coupling factor (superfamily II helicase)|nr:DEAD/DEAH box helicase [Holosporales bacterium]